MEEFDPLKYSFCDTCKVTKEEWKKDVARLKRRYIFLKQKVLKAAHTTITALSDAQSKLDLARSENRRLNDDNVSVRERLRQKLLDQQPLEADAKRLKESLAKLEADLKRVQDQSEAALQHNRQLNSLVADRDTTIKKLRESVEELKGNIAALKKELTAAKVERENLLKKNLKTLHHSIKLCEILRSANLLPNYYKAQVLRQWKRQVNRRKKGNDGELLERMLLSPDGVNSLCSQDTGFDSEESCASDSDLSVRNEGIGNEDSFHDKCPSPSREETVVEESEQIESVTWHSTSAKGSVVCSVEKTSRTSCEVLRVNEDSALLSIFEPTDSEGEEISLILSRTKLRPLLSPLPATPIHEICRTSVDVATCTIVETSSVAVGYEKDIGNSHSEETQTDFILNGCLSCIPRMLQNTDVPDDGCNMLQFSLCKETQTERLDNNCSNCGSGESRSSVQGDKDPSCAQFRTYNTGMIRVDYLQKDGNQAFPRSPSIDGSAVGYITEDVDMKWTRTITRTYGRKGASSPDNLANLPWRVGPRSQIVEEPPTVSDGLGGSDGENSLHLLSDGGGMYNSMLDSRDTEEIQKLPVRKRFRTEVFDNSEVSENEKSVFSDDSEPQENEMDDVSVENHSQRPSKYKRMKLGPGNVDNPYDSEECMNDIHIIRSRRVASTNERKRHALDRPEGMNQRQRRYDSARLRRMHLRRNLRLSRYNGLGIRNPHNSDKFKKPVMNDVDDGVGLTYTRVRTRKITRHIYSEKELGKCKVSKYEQNQRVDHNNRSKDTDNISLRSASPDSGTYVMYNNNNIDSDSHHSLQKRLVPMKEKYNVMKYQKGRKNVRLNPANNEAVGRSTWNYLSDEAEERDSDNVSDESMKVHGPEVLIGSSDDEDRYTGQGWRHSSSHKSSHGSTLLPEKFSYVNQKYMQQFKKGNKFLEIQNKLFSLARSIISKTSSCRSQTHTRRMFEKKKGETTEHCCHHCICPSFTHGWPSQQQTVLRELGSCLNTSLNNSTLKAKKKAVQNRINRRKYALERKRHLQELIRQQIVTNRKAWLNKQSLSSQECGNSIPISSQDVSCISESVSTSSDCLETIVAPECNISLTSNQGMNVTESKSGFERPTHVGENGAGIDKNQLCSNNNTDQNVERCASSSKLISEENFLDSDLESVGSASPTDPNISVPCEPNVANNNHGNVIRIAQIVNSSSVPLSPAGSLVEKHLIENSVDRHNFPSVLGSATINTPALPASTDHCDPLVYRCEISPIKNYNSPITPIKDSQVNLLSSTLVSTKSNDVHSSPETNNDGPLGIQKALLNNLDLMKSSEPANFLDSSDVNIPLKHVYNITTNTNLAATANSFDHSAVNKSIRDVSNMTTDTNLVATVNLLDNSAINSSPNKDVPIFTADTNLAAVANLFDSSAINKSPNKDVSNITTDTNLTATVNLLDRSAVNKDVSNITTNSNLAAMANLFDGSAVSKSPNKDVSSITSTAVVNMQLNSEDCDNDVSLFTSGVDFSTRIQTNLPVTPVKTSLKEILTELKSPVTKTAAELVNKKSFDCNHESPVGTSADRFVSSSIFGSDLDSLNSSDSEDERPLRSKLPSYSNQSVGKSVEASFDQKNTSFNSKLSDRDAVPKQPNQLCSKSETSEFTCAGMKGREKLSRTSRAPPPILTDKRASPLLDSSIVCPTVRRIAHQPKTYSALRKTRSLDTANILNKTLEGRVMAVERSQQSSSCASDLLTPYPLPSKQTPKLLCKPRTVKKVVKPSKKLNKAMAQAKKIAECYKVPKLRIAAASTEVDAEDNDGKRLHISSVVPSVESANVIDSEVKGEKCPKLTPAAVRRLRAVELLKKGKMKSEAQARREASSVKGTVTQGVINKSKVEKVVDTNKDDPEKDCVSSEVLTSSSIQALANKETERVEPPELITNDKSLESSDVKLNNKIESSVSLDSVARGLRSGRKSLNSSSKPLTITCDAELVDSPTVTEGSTLKGDDKLSISPASPEIPECALPVHEPSVIPASPKNQCDGDSSAMVSPPSRRCVQVLRLAMSMCSAERQAANHLAKQRPSDKVRAEVKTSVRLAFDEYLAAAFDSEALSCAVQKLVNVPDVKVVAKCVVRYAADDKSKIVPDPPAPPLSNNLKRLITLVLALQREGPQWQILTEHILGGIEYKLFHLGYSPHVDQATKLTLLYTSLCRILPDRLRVQSFCLMALYALKFNAHAVIYSALTVLPEALPMADVGEDIPLVHCLVYLLLHHSPKSATSPCKVVGLKNMLNKVFGYKCEVETPQLYLRTLIDKLKRGCLEVSPAIILLAKRKEWNWAMKYVLNTGLEPILAEWEQGTVSELVATEAVRLIGYILKCFPKDACQSKSKVVATINHFEKLILDNSIDSHAFKETVASALVCLSRFEFFKVANVLKRWQPKQPMSRNLCNHLQVLMRAKSYDWWSSFLSDGGKPPMNNEVD